MKFVDSIDRGTLFKSSLQLTFADAGASTHAETAVNANDNDHIVSLSPDREICDGTKSDCTDAGEVDDVANRLHEVDEVNEIANKETGKKKRRRMCRGRPQKLRILMHRLKGCIQQEGIRLIR